MLWRRTKKKTDTEAHKFVYYKELAKKAEFKGQFAPALDHYMDSLYHLENDYKYLDKKTEEGWQNRINPD